MSWPSSSSRLTSHCVSQGTQFSSRGRWLCPWWKAVSEVASPAEAGWESSVSPGQSHNRPHALFIYVSVFLSMTKFMNSLLAKFFEHLLHPLLVKMSLIWQHLAALCSRSFSFYCLFLLTIFFLFCAFYASFHSKHCAIGSIVLFSLSFTHYISLFFFFFF